MATWGNYFEKVAIIFLLIVFISAKEENSFRELNRNVQNVVMRQQPFAFESHHVEKRSSRHQIRKRDIAQDEKCKQQKTTFDTRKTNTEFHLSTRLVNDSSGSLSLAWGSANDIVAVTTEEHFIFANPSKTYLSTDGGKSFISMNSKINNAQIRTGNGLQKHPNDPKRLYLAAHDTKQENSGNTILHITTNAGQDFTTSKLPFMLTTSLIFHPSIEYLGYLLVHTQDEKLYISKDNGQSWQKLRDDVITAKWSASNSRDVAQTIYCTLRNAKDQFDIASFFGLKTESQDNDLLKSTDFGATWATVHKHVYSFGIQGKFIYVSVFLTAEGEENNKRIMEVSNDGGASWNEVQLPSIEPERFFSIVEMSGDMVFIHVDEPGNSGYGTLYVSDATGIMFSKSLERHLYPNFVDLTDFYPVNSMRGVYIASQMEDDNSIHSMISYDRGGEWQPIPRPASPCKDETKKCNLQIHNVYSIHSGLRINPPLSVEAARGLILAHGHVAEALQTVIPDVYITTDGGYNWRKVLDGPHHYQIIDQGGLLVAVPLVTYPKVVKFSTDEGHCWHEYNFTSDDVSFTGLLTAPGNKEMSVALWGYGRADRTWRVNVINFDKVITQPCSVSDYDTWTPHFANQQKGCFLGIKETFKKIKQDSWCHNTQNLDLQTSSTKDFCECSKADYDCDYGYNRVVGSEECILNPMFKGPKIDICLRGHEEEQISLGYHKIPGDKCVGSAFHTTNHKIIQLKKVCKEGDRTLLRDQIKSDYLTKEEGRPTNKSNTAVLIAVLTIMILVGVLLLAFVTRRTIFKRTGTYRYSQLNVNDYDQGVDVAIATHNTSLYDDMSDEETHPISSNNTSARVPPALANGVLPKFDKFPANREMRPPTAFSNTPLAPPSSNRTMGGTFNSQVRPLNAQPLVSAVHSDNKSQKKVKSYHDDSDVDMLE